MKIGIIGCSGHANYALGSQHPIVALAPGDPSEDMHGLLELCPNARLFENPHDLLKAVDLVVVNPPFHTIAVWTVAALEAGIPTLAEKPLALTESDLDQIEAVWLTHKTPLTSMLPLRFEPAFHAAWRAVQAGAIGSVRLITAQKSYRLGSRPAFYRDRQTYGGTIPWVGAHSIDLLRWFAGCEFKRVNAIHSTACNHGHGDLEVSAHCQFEMDQDIIAATNIDYFRPVGAPSHGDDRVRVAGTAGVIEVSNETAVLLDQEGQHTLSGVQTPDMLETFITACHDGTPGLVTAEDAIAMTRACLLARRAADTAQPVAF